ncbi:MAG: PDZ domain-containing protein [Betaproteobacteria bacterium]|nr:PDZ domain-containing protein [Betaproteobacteria bacterium]
MTKFSSVRYEILPADPAAHLFEVMLELDRPESGMCFALPAWIPGSYMIREFARNIVWIKGELDGAEAPLGKLDKHTWRLGEIAGGAKRLRLRYVVYAWDLSVRCAHLDMTHGFFNGTQVFLRVLGREQQKHRVRVLPPAGVRDWTVATTLREMRGQGGAKRYGFGWYEADDYAELVDHPVEMGHLTWGRFKVRGVLHEVALNGRHDCDMDRLVGDLAQVCEQQCAVFGAAPPPFERYVFMATLVGEGYGGLEHRASTALLASRNDLPFCGMQTSTEAYRGFLGLCSHEYFHAWHVKRIKPAAFAPYDLQQENYTHLLWLFEGFTSYYDDLALVRAGLISREEYFALLAKTLGAVRRGGGRLVQSVAESSFDAWIKYYRQDENAPNAIVSYYAKGSLIALALDLHIRAKTEGAASLDDLMRLLWSRFGETGVGVPENALPALFKEACGVDISRLLAAAVDGVGDLPLDKLLKPFGVHLAWKAESEQPEIGAKLGSEGEMLKFVQIFNGGPAHRAGLSAGDLLIAVDGLRVKAGGLEKLLACHVAGDRLRLHIFRRDELMKLELTLAAAEPISASLTLAVRERTEAARSRKAWLGQA